MRPSLAYLARGLTLARFLMIPLIVWSLLRIGSVPDGRWRALLVAAYVYAVLSDFADGPLARRAGIRSYFWGQMDALSDIAFNTAALAAAAWTGQLGPWAALGVLMLGAQFVLRCTGGAGRTDEALPEDAAGKWAGVCFYALVGGVVLMEGLSWEWLAPVLPWAGDLVFLYALFLFVRNVRSSHGRS